MGGAGSRTLPRARDLFLKAGELGEAGAFSALGAMYAEGTGVPVDYVKAREYFERAIALGDIAPMCNIGLMYLLGQGVKQDDAAAREWFLKACGAGFQPGCAWADKIGRMKMR